MSGPEGREPTSALDAPGPLTCGSVRLSITGVMEREIVKTKFTLGHVNRPVCVDKFGTSPLVLAFACENSMFSMTP